MSNVNVMIILKNDNHHIQKLTGKIGNKGKYE